jgi:two-component system KDP operon response regulator KdpE
MAYPQQQKCLCAQRHSGEVDDEQQITRVLRTALRGGYDVLTAGNGLDAYRQFEASRIDLIITDLAMPEMNGIELTHAVRRVATTPIIVLSVRDQDIMKVKALDSGANDYLTKPFSMAELLARVRVQLRSSIEEPLQQEIIEQGDFRIDVEAHTVIIAGRPLHLSPKEMELLLLFVRNADRVLTHRVLLRGIWGPGGEDQPENLRVLIAQLRKKLDTGDGKSYVKSEPWVGYRFCSTGVDEGAG